MWRPAARSPRRSIAASIHMLDASKVVAEGEKWQRLYTQIITSRR